MSPEWTFDLLGEVKGASPTEEVRSADLEKKESASQEEPAQSPAPWQEGVWRL